MEAIAYANLRQNLNACLDKVVQNQNPLIITRKNKVSVVLISADEYSSLIETNYLLSNRANADHLRKSIAQHKNGKVKSREIHEDD